MALRTDGQPQTCGNTTLDNLVSQAVTLTRTMSANGAAYAAANCNDNFYTRYFGTFSTGRYATFSSCSAAIASNLAETFGSGQSWFYNCAPTDCTSANTVAYVYPSLTTNHIVHLCNAFWIMADTWTYDSKAGTFIHEMSHFNDVCSTDDVVYGESNSRALATSNPNQAVTNADSYEYFNENQPTVCSTTGTSTQSSSTGTQSSSTNTQSSSTGTGTGTQSSSTTTRTSTSTTSNNGGGGGSSSSGCFHADATVQVLQPNGQLMAKSLRQLAVGDLVESVDAQLNRVFSTVYYLLHADDEQPADLLQITSASGKMLRLTPHHLLLSPASSSPVRADSLVTGDLIFVSEDQGFVTERIVAISKLQAPIRLPLTENDRIVVDGVAASVFAHSESLYRPLTMPLKLAHTHLPSLLHSTPAKLFIDAFIRLTDLVESSPLVLPSPLSV